VVLNSPDDNVFQFQRRNGLPSGDIYSANGGNGQSAPCQTREASSDGDFVILYHGSLVRRNGFDLAVDALARVRKTIPGARLAVCGKRTAYFEGVMESAHQRGLGHGIDYLGVRDLNGIVEAIQNCDLGIIPNHRNIFTEINTPTRIFEYLALAKPVIAPQAPGIRDYFGEDDLIFFELGDADDLARKIEYAASHPADVEKTVERGQEIYLSHTWSRERERLLDAVGDLLSV
jgi:glycosyltransferase involved in cell wall biosynthesis